jgi:hypothetical protein
MRRRHAECRSACRLRGCCLSSLYCLVAWRGCVDAFYFPGMVDAHLHVTWGAQGAGVASAGLRHCCLNTCWLPAWLPHLAGCAVLQVNPFKTHRIEPPSTVVSATKDELLSYFRGEFKLPGSQQEREAGRSAACIGRRVHWVAGGRE